MSKDKPYITYIKDGKEVSVRWLTKKHQEAIFANKEWKSKDYCHQPYYEIDEAIKFVSFQNVVFSPFFMFHMKCLNKDTVVLFDHSFFPNFHDYRLTGGSFEFSSCDFAYSPEITGHDLKFFSISRGQGEKIRNLHICAEEIMLRDMTFSRAELKAKKLTLTQTSASDIGFYTKDITLNNSEVKGLMSFGPSSKKLTLNESKLFSLSNKRLILPDKVILKDSVITGKNSLTIKQSCYHAKSGECKIDSKAQAQARLITTLRTVNQQVQASSKAVVDPYKAAFLQQRDQKKSPYWEEMKEINEQRLADIYKTQQTAALRKKHLQEEIDRINNWGNNKIAQINESTYEKSSVIEAKLNTIQAEYEENIENKKKVVETIAIKNLLRRKKQC